MLKAARGKKLLLAISLVILLIVLSIIVLKVIFRVDVEELVQPSAIIANNANVSGSGIVQGNEIELKVLTFNIKGLSNPATDGLEQRIDLISDAIGGHDIVSLQETFSYKTTALLEDSKYPYYIKYDNRSFLSFGSGLSTLSRYEIIEYDYMEFASCDEEDCFANKGVLFTRIRVSAFGDIDVYNTHYQADSEYSEIRKGQNKEFFKFFEQKDSGNLTIIAGDFNFEEGSEEYKEFIALFQPKDTFRLVNPDDPGITPQGSRIDYIFLLEPQTNSEFEVTVYSSKVVFDEKQQGLFLSDHFGVLTVLKLSKLH